MSDLIYKKAGHLELIRYRDSKHFLFNGVVQSIVPSITNNTNSLDDGNSDWDLDFSSGKTGQITVNLNSFQPELYAALTTMTSSTDNSYTMRKIQSETIPESGTYTVTLGQETSDVSTMVVVDDSNSPYSKVASNPASGQFSVSATTVTFNSANAGTEVMIAYDATVASDLIQLPSETNNDIFRMIVSGTATLRSNEATTKADELKIDRVMPVGDIAPPPRQKDVQGWNFNLKIQKPRPGQKAVSYAVAQ